MYKCIILIFIFLIKITFPRAYGIAVLSQAKITDKLHFEGVFNLYAFFIALKSALK